MLASAERHSNTSNKSFKSVSDQLDLKHFKRMEYDCVNISFASSELFLDHGTRCPYCACLKRQARALSWVSRSPETRTTSGLPVKNLKVSARVYVQYKVTIQRTFENLLPTGQTWRREADPSVSQ